jgi:transmembrane sensor
MDYSKYSAEDLALDGEFQKWVLDPTPEINAFWTKWLSQNPDQNNIVAEAAELIKSAGLSKDKEMNEAYLSVWNNLNDHAEASRATMSGRGWRYAKIAAAVTFLIVSAFLLWTNIGESEVLSYRTGYGEIKEFVLSDGSHVTLNSNSQLTLPSAFGNEQVREVTLEGEAFFEIVKTNDRKGFRVTANDVRVYVLGTEFNVNTRHEQVKVYLQSGKVQVNAKVGDVTMNPGDLVVYRTGDRELKVDRGIVEPTQLLSWKAQILVFNDASLADVIRELEDNYGFKITLQDKSLSEKRITAKIPGKNAEVLLSVLSETLGIQIERKGNEIIFR